MTRKRAMRTLENVFRRLGFLRIAGVDEVGRGCLAGPVMAAAVVLDPERHIPALSDSKQVGAPERERLYEEIVCRGAAWAVGVAEVIKSRKKSFRAIAVEPEVKAAAEQTAKFFADQGAIVELTP